MIGTQEIYPHTESLGAFRLDILDMATVARPRTPTPIVLAEEGEQGTWSDDERCFSGTTNS